MIRFDDFKVLVTGGGRGIGAACCAAFAGAGAAVLVAYRANARAAHEVLERLPKPSSGRHLVHGADLCRADELESLFDLVEREWGALDCLVNNAGVWVRNPLPSLDGELLSSTLRINVEAPFHCARRALPLLGKSENASIVNISSTAGQRGEARYSPYAASKGAVIAATKSWSSELAPGVRVNAVAPGWVDTEMCVEPFAGEGRRRIAEGIPLGRVASADDIAGPVVFLASRLARHVTGEILNVNGGSVLAG